MMMGPEPRIRIFEMSVRLGIYVIIVSRVAPTQVRHRSRHRETNLGLEISRKDPPLWARSHQLDNASQRRSTLESRPAGIKARRYGAKSEHPRFLRRLHVDNLIRNRLSERKLRPLHRTVNRLIEIRAQASFCPDV